MSANLHAQDPAGAPQGTPADRPTKIGRYLVLNLVGKGAMGEVYAAYDPELDRKVAIKLLRGNPGAGAEAAEGRLRMMREAQAIAKLSHPNVIGVYDVGPFLEQVFVAMEFIDGHTLGYWIHAEPRSWSDVLRIFADAGRGLAAAHEKNLVHRDFKPDNVMISVDGQVRVMDFGLARTVDANPKGKDKGQDGEQDARQLARQDGSPPGPASAIHSAAAAIVDSEDIKSTIQIGKVPPASPSTGDHHSTFTSTYLTQTGAILGTPAYMSPEQFLGRETDPRTDQFSFCVALYEALYGQRPFEGNSHQALEANVHAGHVRQPPAKSEVPAWVRALLLRGLRPDPNDRWPSMKVLLDEIEKKRHFARRRRFADGAAAKLNDIWQPPLRGQPVETPARREMREAFLATGKRYAAATFEKVSQILDGYAKSWSDMYIDIYQATHVRGDQSTEVLDLRMACLMDLRERLRVLCRVFRQANPEVVENALRAVDALGNVDRCADLEFLLSAVKPPQNPSTRATVEGLRARLAEVRVLCQVGRLTDGLRVVATIEPEVRGVDYAPLLAELLLEVGKLLIERRDGEAAAKALEEAVWAAELCRHDEVAAEAAGALVFATGEVQHRFDIAEIWSRHAETILRRLGGHDILWGWLLNNRGAVCQQQGRLDQALADMRLAVAAKERASGPDSPDVALSLGNIALYLTENDQADQALPVIERCLKIVDNTLGREHPRSAVIYSNYAEVLNDLGRFEQARHTALHALAIFEREMVSDNDLTPYPLASLGVAWVGEGRPEEAVPVLERAAAICADDPSDAVHAAGINFALARALFALGRDATRVRSLATRARVQYQEAPRIPLVARQLRRVEAFLATTVPAADGAARLSDSAR